MCTHAHARVCVACAQSHACVRGRADPRLLSMSIHMSIHMSVCMSIHMSILRAHPRLLRMLARSLSSTARTMVHARARAVPAAYGRIGESVAGQMVVCTAGKEPKFEAEIDGTAAAALQAAPATTGSGSLPHVAMWGVCTHVALTHACTSACGAWVRRELKIDWRRLPPVCTRARARTHARTHTHMHAGARRSTLAAHRHSHKHELETFGT